MRISLYRGLGIVDIAAVGIAAVGIAVVGVTAAVPAAAMSGPHAEQVALVSGSDAQLPFKSDASGTGQVASHDARFVVFSTAAPLVSWDRNDTDDVYRRDTRTGRTTLVSERDGTPGDDASFEPTISADGDRVAFTTWATNLTPDSNGAVLDVVVKTMTTGRLELASRTTAGVQRPKNSFFPVISGNGRFVSFQTFGRFARSDADLVEDVYVRDLALDQTRHVSLLPDGGDVPHAVLNGDISDDGRRVVFGDANNLYVRYVAAERTVRFWREPNGPPCQSFPIGSAGRPVISGNGQFVAFASCALALPGEDGRATDVYRMTLATRQIVRVHPAANANSYLPSLSRSGRYVGFASDASTLVPGDDEGQPDGFVADTATGTLTRASQSASGVGGNNWSATNSVAISGDGAALAFVSYADNLVEGDEFDFSEVFLWRSRG